MNVRMIHKATQQNLKILKDYGYHFIGQKKVKWPVENMVKVKCLVPGKYMLTLKNNFDQKNIIKRKKSKL